MRPGRIRRVHHRSSFNFFWRTSEGAAALTLLFSHKSSSSMEWDFRSSEIDTGSLVRRQEIDYDNEHRSAERRFQPPGTNVKRYLYFRGDRARLNWFFWFRLESAGHSNDNQERQCIVDVQQCDPRQHGCEYFYFNNWIRFFRITIKIYKLISTNTEVWL